MTPMLTFGIALAGLALVLGLLNFMGAVGNMQRPPAPPRGGRITPWDPEPDFDQRLNRHLGHMKKMALIGVLGLVGVGLIVAAVLRDFVLPLINK